jgi:tRNA nucleotidyltransferase (CCA-adding enzyme)
VGAFRARRRHRSRGHWPDEGRGIPAGWLTLTAVVTEPAKVSPVHPVPAACEAPSDELLLVEWLNALIYEMAVRGMLFCDFSVEIDDGRLHATAYGEAVDVERHEPAVEIKGATLTALQVAQGADGWRAQCVVDV